MIALQVAVLLLAWVALFSLLVVVPWGIIRVVGSVLEADVEAITARWRPPVPKRKRDQRDTTEVALTDDR